MAIADALPTARAGRHASDEQRLEMPTHGGECPGRVAGGGATPGGTGSLGAGSTLIGAPAHRETRVPCRSRRAGTERIPGRAHPHRRNASNSCSRNRGGPRRRADRPPPPGTSRSARARHLRPFADVRRGRAAGRLGTRPAGEPWLGRHASAGVISPSSSTADSTDQGSRRGGGLPSRGGTDPIARCSCRCRV